MTENFLSFQLSVSQKKIQNTIAIETRTVSETRENKMGSSYLRYGSMTDLGTQFFKGETFSHLNKSFLLGRVQN